MTILQVEQKLFVEFQDRCIDDDLIAEMTHRARELMDDDGVQVVIDDPMPLPRVIPSIAVPLMA